jgi:hypothetical protein
MTESPEGTSIQDLAAIDGAATGMNTTGLSPDDGVPRPVLWAALTAEEAEYEWQALDEWIEDLRHYFVIDSTIIPPFWHRHQLLVEHLSALRTHWLGAFAEEQNGSAPFGWIRDLDEWKGRMREAVAQLGTRLDADRPEQLALWPGETPPAPDTGGALPPINLTDRYDDFRTCVKADIARRAELEANYRALVIQTALTLEDLTYEPDDQDTQP